MAGKVEGFVLGSNILVWSAESIEWLRTRWHLAGGGEIGALPSSPRQNDRLGLPLLLLPEEVSLLLDKGILEVTPSLTDKEKQVCSKRDQPLRNLVFKDLWEHGFFLTSGLKYGGDFLVYEEDPSRRHSLYIALIVPWKQTITSLVALARIATQVKKKVLLCSSTDEGQPEPYYYTLEWAGIT